MLISDKGLSKDQKNLCTEIGEYLFKGAFLRLTSEIFILAAIGIILLLVFYQIDPPDPKTDWEKAGMALHVDPETGVNYLSTEDGAMVVRLRPDESVYVSK